MLNVLVNDSRSLVKVCELLIQKRENINFGDEELSLIDDLLINQINNNNHLETIWLLYLRKKLFSKRLYSKISSLIINSDNDIAKIIIIEEYKSSLSPAAINKIIYSANSWLLCYQLFYGNYISKNEFSAKTHITKNLSFYARLKREGFSFYRNNIQVTI